jgi:hypothetical protein
MRFPGSSGDRRSQRRDDPRPFRLREFDADQTAGRVFAARFSSPLIQVNAPTRRSGVISGNRKREDSVPNRNSRPKGIRADGSDELFECRIEMLGVEAIGSGEAFDEIRRGCKSCGYREACSVDLKRDPNSPVWETYCPNASKFLMLAEDSWVLK